MCMLVAAYAINCKHYCDLSKIVSKIAVISAALFQVVHLAGGTTPPREPRSLRSTRRQGHALKLRETAREIPNQKPQTSLGTAEVSSNIPTT